MFIINKYLKELKIYTIYILISITLTTTLAYIYNYEAFYLISKPIINNNNQFNFIFTNIFEAFKTYLTLSIIIGFHFNIPFILWFIWKFLIKGLYKYENNIILKITFFTTVLILLINILFYKIIMPIIITFLLQFENLLEFNPINIQIQLKLEEYFTIYIQLIYIFNLTFLIPFLFLFIDNIKWIFYKKYIYIVLLTIIALITPPDIISLVLFFLPTFLTLEVSHLIKRISYK